MKYNDEKILLYVLVNKIRAQMNYFNNLMQICTSKCKYFFKIILFIHSFKILKYKILKLLSVNCILLISYGNVLPLVLPQSYDCDFIPSFYVKVLVNNHILRTIIKN